MKLKSRITRIEQKHCGFITSGLSGVVLHVQLTETYWLNLGVMRHDWGWRVRIPFLGDILIDDPTKGYAEKQKQWAEATRKYREDFEDIN